MNRREFFGALRVWMIPLIGSFPLARFLAGRAGWTAATPTETPQTDVDRAGTVAGPVKIPAPGATLQSVLARPQSRGPHSAVLLILPHSGLDDRIERVARSFSQAGFVALAVDVLTRHGGGASFASLDGPSGKIDALASDEVLVDLDAAFDYLKSHPSVGRDCIGIAGIAGGGQWALRYAALNSKLKAAVVFSPTKPDYEAGVSQYAWKTNLEFLRQHLGRETV